MTRRHSTTTEKPTYEPSFWKGSLHTAAMVAAQIEARWGAEEAEKYDPETNCFTYATWQSKGFHPRKGEKGLLSSTIRYKYDDEGNEIASWPSKCWLFYYLQVEKNDPQKPPSPGDLSVAEYIMAETLGLTDDEDEEA